MLTAGLIAIMSKTRNPISANTKSSCLTNAIVITETLAIGRKRKRAIPMLISRVLNIEFDEVNEIVMPDAIIAHAAIVPQLRRLARNVSRFLRPKKSEVSFS